MQQELIDKIKNITTSSGVYKFINENDEILYIGKAKNLRKRLISYTKTDKLSARISRMTFLARKLEIITTNSDLEAILLEHNLIKKHRPKFNILLKDDKKFASIAIDKKHDFGRIFKHRNTKTKDLYTFGPFASGYDSNRVIDILRKCFKLRNCSDNEFKRRERPCLEYQIKKCSAPCVEYISKEEYQESIKKALDVLEGKTAHIQQDLAIKMQKYSQAQKYEQASVFRDQIKSLTSIQAKQNINLSQINNADIITLIQNKKDICIYISFYRNGNNFGAKPYFDNINDDISLTEFFSQFLCQLYIDSDPPSEIFLNHEISDQNLVEELFSEIAKKKIKIHIPKQGKKLELINDQENIAKKLLDEKIAKNLSDKKLLVELKEKFNLEKIPNRIEIYDNSHTSTQNAVAGMVVFDQNGFNKNQYRKFNIKFDYKINTIDDSSLNQNIQRDYFVSDFEQRSVCNQYVSSAKSRNGKISKNITGLQSNRDDTAMMKESLSRRFKHFKEEKSPNHEFDPDLIIIDGGLPQLSAVKEVFLALKINIPVICMAKGENRNAGEETYFTIDANKINMEKNSALAFFLQRLRDEAHRFAITTHRTKRAKAITKSKLDDIDDIGAKRKKLLLNHFGSLEKIKNATLGDLTKISGISEKTAQKILNSLRD